MPNTTRSALRPLLALFLFVFVASPLSRSASVAAFEPRALPEITAQAVFSIDVSANVVLYQDNADEPLQPASTTKVATAIVVLEQVDDLNEPIEITESDMVDWEHESHMGVEVGEVWTVEDLLYGLMLPSGNDAALALARYVGAQINGDDPTGAFVGEMNAVAESMGLEQTHFTNPLDRSREDVHRNFGRSRAP
jgi:D-alanyl-D-alanine carboxypeptidase (penicillin-binding protein 5/6)